MVCRHFCLNFRSIDSNPSLLGDLDGCNNMVAIEVGNAIVVAGANELVDEMDMASYLTAKYDLAMVAAVVFEYGLSHRCL